MFRKHTCHHTGIERKTTCLWELWRMLWMRVWLIAPSDRFFWRPAGHEAGCAVFSRFHRKSPLSTRSNWKAAQTLSVLLTWTFKNTICNDMTKTKSPAERGIVVVTILRFQVKLKNNWRTKNKKFTFRLHNFRIWSGKFLIAPSSREWISPIVLGFSVSWRLELPIHVSKIHADGRAFHHTEIIIHYQGWNQAWNTKWTWRQGQWNQRCGGMGVLLVFC